MKAISTAKQRKCLCVLIRKLGWTDYIIENWFKGYYGTESPDNLDIEQASNAIQDLSGMLENQMPPGHPRKATNKQVCLIKYLWLDVDYSRGENGDKHLSAFLEKRFGVKTVYDLTCKQATVVIGMINRMIRQAKERESKTTVLKKKGKCKYCGQKIMWVQIEDGRRMPFDFDNNDKATDFHECIAIKGHAAGS